MTIKPVGTGKTGKEKDMKKVRIIGIIFLVITILVLIINAFYISLPDVLVRTSGIITLIDAAILSYALKKYEECK